MNKFGKYTIEPDEELAAYLDGMDRYLEELQSRDDEEIIKRSIDNLIACRVLDSDGKRRSHIVDR